MPVSMAALVADLRDETDDLLALVASLRPSGWDTPTPADGWTVRDQVGHLAHFDVAATEAVRDPDGFRSRAAAALAAGPGFVDEAAVAARARPVGEVLGWFTTARTALIDTFTGADPAARLPWFGPDMSAASAVTARLMETWAHGQDVADALGQERTPTARLRHVAHIGVATRGHAYRLRRREAPEDPVRVALAAPDGTTWTWGDLDAAEVVTGPALDFALVVTQRRHLDATALVTTAGARDWLLIAQAYAGAPGPGRPV